MNPLLQRLLLACNALVLIPPGSATRIPRHAQMVDYLNEAEKIPDPSPEELRVIDRANGLHRAVMADGDAWAAFYRAPAKMNRQQARGAFRRGFDLQVRGRA